MEPRWDPVSASTDPGRCLPGSVFLHASILTRWPAWTGNAGCYLHNGKTDAGTPSFHARGRANDTWVATGHVPVGDEIFAWAHANRNEIGLNEVIFNGRIWRADHPEKGIHAYTVNPHRDHVHLAINLDGARMGLPWYQHQGHTPTAQ